MLYVHQHLSLLIAINIRMLAFSSPLAYCFCKLYIVKRDLAPNSPQSTSADYLRASKLANSVKLEIKTLNKLNNTVQVHNELSLRTAGKGESFHPFFRIFSVSGSSDFLSSTESFVF